MISIFPFYSRREIISNFISLLLYNLEAGVAKQLRGLQ
jgi:hypothetical protein